MLFIYLLVLPCYNTQYYKKKNINDHFKILYNLYILVLHIGD
jgi:hypothetical protein